MRSVRLMAVAILTAAAAQAQDTPPGAGFTPGFDDLMTMLVQPRHIKLYSAGTAKNWELAGAEARNLRSAFDRIAQANPRYLGNDVKASLVSMIGPQMKALDTAIARADAKGFAAAYKDLTDGCNACHTYMERPFLVMKVPEDRTDSALPDQDFRPQP